MDLERFWNSTHAVRAGRRVLARAVVLLALGVPALPAPCARAQDAPAGSAAVADAWLLVDARLFDLAAAVLRDHLTANPADLPARSLLARVLSWDRRFDESIAEYERLLAEHPDDPFERASYARVLAWSGRFDRSLAEFRRALAADSTDRQARLDYARALSWSGDLSGAAIEYRRLLGTDPAFGDAWLGYATLARWRSGATASDRFLARAEALGAEPLAAGAERSAVLRAFEPAVGGGWEGSRERHYTDGPDFTTGTSGPFANGRFTVGRTADLSMRAAWLHQFERTESGNLSYDLDARLLRADLAFLRGYPFQTAAGLEYRRVDAGALNVTHPLTGSGDFVGWGARTWWFLGRFTPALAARRDFVPIKSTAGPALLSLGHLTRIEGTLAWQWSGRGNATAGLERGVYSDGNVRRAARGGASYRVRGANPATTVDYAIAWTDFDRVSRSYFTPLGSLRQAVGLGVTGYSERAEISYGARYRFSHLGSRNFADIRTHSWSGYFNGTVLGAIPLGIDGSYSRDNNDYEIWTVGIHASARW